MLQISDDITSHDCVRCRPSPISVYDGIDLAVVKMKLVGPICVVVDIVKVRVQRLVRAIVTVVVVTAVGVRQESPGEVNAGVPEIGW